MIDTEALEATAERIRARVGSEPIEAAIVLGTGLGATMDHSLEDQIAFSYSELPAFPAPSVSGHDGRLAVGCFEGVRTACLVGRSHYYETGDLRAMLGAFETLALLGVRNLLLTCSVGSCNADIAPGTLALVTDHINASGLNPLVGTNAEAGLITMNDAYDPRLIKRMRRASVGGGIPLREGVYMWYPGPSFETPAEVRMARTLGADLLGMSLVPEVILARRLALRVVAVAIVTNFGAGFLNGSPTHSHTKEMAQQGSIGMKRLIRAFYKTRDEAWGAKGREALR